MSRHTVASVRVGAVLLVLSAALRFSPLLAATINVPGTHATIQAAINAATAGDEVVVAAGTYHERLNFGGKAITVRSTDPTSPSVVAATIINGDAGGSVVVFNHGETAAAVLSGFTLTNGTGTPADGGNQIGGAVYTIDASPTISHNLIFGNSATFGGGIYCERGSTVISYNTIRAHSVMFSGGGVYTRNATPFIGNNIITGNLADYWGGGIHIQYGGGTILNNTIHGNGATRYYGAGVIVSNATPSLSNNIITSATNGGGIYLTTGATPNIRYCNVYGNTGGNYVNLTDQTGTNGNLSVDPLFANAATGDFHLKSIAGRWNGTGWVNDAVSSPCIDAGDPASQYANEPSPNGGRVNMGAYGNTAYASKSGTVVAGFSISGLIRDGSSHGVANVQVSTGAATATTDASGAYTVSGLAAGTYTVTPTLTGYSFTPATLEVTVGPNATGQNFTATAGGAPPTVIANLPTGTHVNPEMPLITVAFSAAMDHEAAEGAFSLTPAPADPGMVVWPGKFTWTGNQMRYKLSSSLAPGTVYTVTVGTGALSAAGVPMAADRTWTFTTTNAPAIVSYAPTGTAAPLTTAKVIRIAFNQPMNKVSAQNALWLYKTGTTPGVQHPLGYFGWSGNEMRFTLRHKLDPLTGYTVKLVKSAKSKGGVSRSSDFTWSFRTGAAGSAPATVAVAAAPTAGGAQITLTLGAEADVTVAVCNLAGRQVAALQAGPLEAGTRTLSWNGRSTTGQKLPAGSYLLRVQARGAAGSVATALGALVLRP